MCKKLKKGQQEKVHPQPWLTDQCDLKQEIPTLYVSDDESEGEDEPGDIETKFTYTKTNSNEKPNYTCSDCDKMFRDNSELCNHTSNHHKEIYKCMKCSTVCRSVCSLYNHYDSHQKPANQCPVQECGMIFDLKTSLINHMQKLSDFRMTCKTCGKQFQYRQSLNTLNITIDQQKQFSAPFAKDGIWPWPVCALTMQRNMDLSVNFTWRSDLLPKGLKCKETYFKFPSVTLFSCFNARQFISHKENCK